VFTWARPAPVARSGMAYPTPLGSAFPSAVGEFRVCEGLSGETTRLRQHRNRKTASTPAWQGWPVHWKGCQCWMNLRVRTQFLAQSGQIASTSNCFPSSLKGVKREQNHLSFIVARWALYSRALCQHPSVHCQLTNYRTKVPGLQAPKLLFKENLLQTFSVISM